MLQPQHRELVDRRVLGQVLRVRLGRSQDQSDLLPHGTGPEKEDHAADKRPELAECISREEGIEKRNVHQRMREPHFGTVDGAIARGFHDSEVICVFGIENHAL